MFVDYRTHYSHRIQYVTSLVAMPFQYAIDLPVEFVEWVGDSISTQHSVLEQNASLRARQLLLQARLQRLTAIESENAQLRALLQSAPHVNGRYTVAELLSVNMNPAVQELILNKGIRDKIYIGQPVLDPYGVLGQVVAVGPDTSRVLLITDKNSGIPVQDSRNGIRANVLGTGTDMLKLANIPNTTDIQAGDELVTSGLEQRYPSGYPVGVVKKVIRNREYRFATILVAPSARMNSGSQVLLVWPNDTTPAPSETVNADKGIPTTQTEGATAHD